MKFYPLTLQDAVMSEKDLSGAKTYLVSVYNREREFTDVELQNCTVWQLLNVDVDQACRFFIQFVTSYSQHHHRPTPM